MRLNIQLTALSVVVGVVLYLLVFSNLFASEYHSKAADLIQRFVPLPVLDTADYDARLLALAHLDRPITSTSSAIVASSTRRYWPADAGYPNAGAILPFKRIVAYYGNFYSANMGALGEYPVETLLPMLKREAMMWEAADPATPVVPAIHYIAVVAQAHAGKEGKYILRMPDDQIEHALDLARHVDGIVFLDVQVGLSTLERELPLLENYLKLPQVHLGIDPEFSMKHGEPPGTVIGTLDAADINYAIQYLSGLVREHNLPPKILIVHRFTLNMVTNYKQIQPTPEVQVVINMDGFGSKEKKRGTYSRVIYPEPVQFAGIKLFYKNDVRPPSTGLLKTEEVLALTPVPIYIQYQ